MLDDDDDDDNKITVISLGHFIRLCFQRCKRLLKLPLFFFFPSFFPFLAFLVIFSSFFFLFFLSLLPTYRTQPSPRELEN